jgi:multidrug transporter EmrE-like cation transporter
VLSLGGALLLVALYLPWQRLSLDLSEFGNQRGSVGSLLHLFAGTDSLDGWESGVAPAAALAALLLIGLSGAAHARPGLVARLPLGRCALVTAYFAIAVAVDVRSHAMRLSGGPEANGGVDLEAQVAYATYIGIGAAAVALLGALMLRRAELSVYRSPGAAAGVPLAFGLLTAFLLPWARFAGFENTGISGPAAQVAAVFAICMPAASSAPVRLGLAVLTALFTAAAFSTTTFPYGRAYGAWIGIGFALALVVLSLKGGGRRPDVGGVPWSRLVLGASCLLLMAGFFLPWQEFCYPPESGPISGRCVSVNGWQSESGAGAAVLAIALILGELARIRRLPPRAELAAGIALLVTTLGFQFGYGGEFRLGYGFWVGAVCTVVIVVLSVAGLRRPPLDERFAPIALCLAYLAVVVPTWWGVLSFDAPRFFWFAPFSWITVVGALLALTLIRLWLERPPDTRQLFLVPATMAVLATLDLVRAETMTWGGGIVLGLCALLGLFAWVEHAGGLRTLRIPEALRVDRL